MIMGARLIIRVTVTGKSDTAVKAKTVRPMIQLVRTVSGPYLSLMHL